MEKVKQFLAKTTTNKAVIIVAIIAGTIGAIGGIMLFKKSRNIK
jgi:hypothetical protein